MANFVDEICLELPYDARGVFVERPNRFVGVVDITEPRKYSAAREPVHIHDPGRLSEILFPENTVFLKRENQSHRRTKWDLLAGLAGEDIVFVNSRYHREIATELIYSGKISGRVKKIIPEYKFGGSRIDFLLEKPSGEKIFVETKGCTLCENEVALFPDAPTSRGKRHIEELKNAVEQGFSAVVLFLVFRRDARCFLPNWKTDPNFSSALMDAIKSGVRTVQALVSYDGKKIKYLGQIPMCEKMYI